MVITKKIEKSEKEIEAERAKVIEKGASVSNDQTRKEEDRKSIVIRMPAEFLQRIDQTVGKRVGMNRMAWILQAIQEKLERDNG